MEWYYLIMQIREHNCYDTSNLTYDMHRERRDHKTGRKSSYPSYFSLRFLCMLNNSNINPFYNVNIAMNTTTRPAFKSRALAVSGNPGDSLHTGGDFEANRQHVKKYSSQ